jgi:5'-deoxynucleotidase
MENENFYAYINRMKYINRWGLMRNTVNENIQEHSLQVAILAHALAIIKNLYFNGNVNEEKACLYAVFHDTNEIITGDLPTPVKYYNPDIKEAYKNIEMISKDKLLSMLPADFSEIYRKIIFFDESDSEYKNIVKAADRLSAYIKCIEEIKAGNSEFVKAKQTIENSIIEMNLPELNYFMDHFIGAYYKSLDELE